jgi:hypothetical protein
MTMAQVLKAWLHLLGADPSARPVARASCATASRAAGLGRVAARRPRVLGMHAFGLEETGDHAQAEAQGRHGVELEPRDRWAWHAVAHVPEMRHAPREGIAWLRPVRSNAHRFGGSHAQRDLIDQTLLWAAARGTRRGIGRALINERLMSKPATPLSQHWRAQLDTRAGGAG